MYNTLLFSYNNSTKLVKVVFSEGRRLHMQIQLYMYVLHTCTLTTLAFLQVIAMCQISPYLYLTLWGSSSAGYSGNTGAVSATAGELMTSP